MAGAILILSGPSGSGKSSLCQHLFDVIPEARFSISTTTRDKRPGETHGKEYFFVTKDEFEAQIDQGDFLEWAEVHGNYYGTSKSQTEKALNEGKLIIFDIDVQGQANIQKQLPDLITSVFVTTPTRSILKERLTGRGSDSPEAIKRRLQKAADEIEHLNAYDYFLINDNLEKSKLALEGIARAAMLRTSLFSQEAFLESWLQ